MVKVEADFDETEFTTTKMTEMFDEAYIHYLDNNTNSDVRNPEKFSFKKRDIWEEAVRNFLQTKIGVTNLPISYAINKDTNPLTMDNSELIIYNVSLNTEILKDEIRKVANILIHLSMNTDAFEWNGINITQSKRREVCLDLVSH